MADEHDDPMYDGRICDDGETACMAPDCPCAHRLPNDRCDKCGAHKSAWATTECVQSLTQSPRHTITRFYITEGA